MASSNNDGLHAQETNLYKQWMKVQESELSDLLHALKLSTESKITDSELTQLIEKSIKNFQDYMEARSHLARQDPTPFLAPPWCTTLENSGLWLGGCRPSSFIRLIYCLCGMEIETQLAEYLAGISNDGNLGNLSAIQIGELDKIRMKAIREEGRLSGILATLQENMSDQPLAEVVKKPNEGCEANPEVHSFLDDNGEEMAKLVEEADNVRLETVKELIGLMTPLQAVQFMAATKKLRVCMGEWGKKRDNDQGRSQVV